MDTSRIPDIHPLSIVCLANKRSSKTGRLEGRNKEIALPRKVNTELRDLLTKAFMERWEPFMKSTLPQVEIP